MTFVRFSLNRFSFHLGKERKTKNEPMSNVLKSLALAPTLALHSRREVPAHPLRRPRYRNNRVRPAHASDH